MMAGSLISLAKARSLATLELRKVDTGTDPQAERQAAKRAIEQAKRDSIDVLIPRGGPSLIKAILENATVPYVIDGDGNCHVYVDASADLDQALDIVVNAKTQRPSVCNAAESLLVHEAVAAAFPPRPDLGARTPADLAMAYEDVTVTSGDGVRLSGWYVPSRNRAASLFSSVLGDWHTLREVEDVGDLVHPARLAARAGEHGKGFAVVAAEVRKLTARLVEHGVAAAQLMALVFTSGSTGVPVPHRKVWGEVVLDVRAEAQHPPTVEGVTLASLHASKGLEWDAVFLVGLVEGTMPIQYADGDEAKVEEERRLVRF